MIIVRDGQQMGKKCCIFAADLRGEYGQNNPKKELNKYIQYRTIFRRAGNLNIRTFLRQAIHCLSTRYPPLNERSLTCW